MADRFALDGRIAVVTGANSGLGLAIAQGFIGAGATVIAVVRNAAKVAGMAGLAGVIEHDVRDRDHAADVVSEAERRFGAIDILVNCAGRGGRAPVEEYPWEVWDDVFATNVTGLFALARAAGPLMAARNRGSIINIASVGAVAGYAGSAGYQASKGAVAQLTRSLAMEWAAHDVRVNAILPSQFATDMVRRQWEDEPELRDVFRARTPLARQGVPDDIVGPAIFLASDASAMVTGHLLAVDGGYLAQ